MSEKELEERLVTITPEDCEAAFDFFTHFNIPKIPDLDEALAAFKKEQTYENQQKIKLAVVKAVSFTEHEAFKDEMFKNIVPECQEIYDEMTFDKELEKVLTEAK